MCRIRCPARLDGPRTQPAPGNRAGHLKGTGSGDELRTSQPRYPREGVLRFALDPGPRHHSDRQRSLHRCRSGSPVRVLGSPLSPWTAPSGRLFRAICRRLRGHIAPGGVPEPDHQSGHHGHRHDGCGQGSLESLEKTTWTSGGSGPRKKGRRPLADPRSTPQAIPRADAVRGTR